MSTGSRWARAASWTGPSRLHVNQESGGRSLDRYLESGRNIRRSFPGCQPHELLRMDWLKLKLSTKLREIYWEPMLGWHFNMENPLEIKTLVRRFISKDPLIREIFVDWLKWLKWWLCDVAMLMLNCVWVCDWGEEDLVWGRDNNFNTRLMMQTDWFECNCGLGTDAD